MIGCASSIPQKSTAARVPSGPGAVNGRSRGRERLGSQLGRRRAPARRGTGGRSRCGSATTQPKQAPKPHAIPDSSASCAGISRTAAQQPHRLEHRRRPARVHLGVGVAVELVVEQLGDEPVMAAAAVVGRDLRARAGAPRRRRARRRGIRAARSPVAELVLPDRQRRDPDAAADQQRPPSVARPARSRCRADRRATVRPRARARTGGWSPARRPRPGTEARPHRRPRRRGAGAQDAERARQERPLAGSPAPAVAPPSACRTGPAAGADRRDRRTRARRRRRSCELPVTVATRAPNGAVTRCARVLVIATPGWLDGRGGAPAARPSWPAVAVQLLERDHVGLAAARGGDRPSGGHPAGHRRDAGDAAGHRRRADLVPVRARAGADRRVDHQVDRAALDPVDDVRRALADLVDLLRPAPPSCGSTARSRGWR